MNGAIVLAVMMMTSALTPEASVEQANKRLTEGDYDGAIAAYGEAQPERPNSPEIDVGLGLAYAAKGDHERAAERFSSATAKGQGRLASVAKFNLGNTRVAQGRLEDALEAYEDALKMDAANEDARINLEIVRGHIEAMKRAEEQRKKAEEEFKKRLEELMKELKELVDIQSKAVAQIWTSEPSCEGPLATEEDARELEMLAKEKKPLGDDLASKVARSLVKMRNLEVQSATGVEIADAEQKLAARAHEAAETAGRMAADLRQASGPPPSPPQPQGGQPAQGETPTEHPLVGALERAGGALEEAAGSLNRTAGALKAGGSPGWSTAEPHATLALWKFLQALGELAQSQQSDNQMDEALKKLLKRMADLRRRQGMFVLDVWKSFPHSRGIMPTPEAQKTFWEMIRNGQTPKEVERAIMARLEISASGMQGRRGEADGLSKAESSLAEEARGLATEVEALAATAGGQAQELGPLLEMLRSSAEAMDESAAKLALKPAATNDAESAAVVAFVRLSRVPSQMDELLARLGALLAEQTARALDTWTSDPSSKGRLPTEEELERSREMIAQAFQGSGEIEPGLEAQLGRVAIASIDESAGGKLGQKRDKAEAAKRQRELVEPAREVSADMGKLAVSGRPGEQNPAAAMLGSAAKDVDAAIQHMENAAASLATSFPEGEPLQARAVTALMRALARFSSGAAGQSEQDSQEGQEQEGQQSQEQQGESEQKDGEQKEGQEAEERASDEEHKQDEEKRKEAQKREEVSEKQAQRMLEEVSQEEREIRRNIRKRQGGREVEVRWDW